MDKTTDQTISTETPSTPLQTPEAAPSASVPPPRSKSHPWIILFAIIVVLILLAIAYIVRFGVVQYQQATQQQNTGTTSPTLPSSMATPTPIRAVWPVATTSAFLQLEIAVASLSAHISGTNTQDPSLNPPAFDLPLGFTQSR